MLFVIVRIGCDDELDPGMNSPSPMLSLSDLVFFAGFEDFPPDMRSRANEFKMPRVPAMIVRESEKRFCTGAAPGRSMAKRFGCTAAAPPLSTMNPDGDAAVLLFV